MTWADGSAGLNHEQLLVATSRERGATWTTPAAVPMPSGDRPVYTAPAISPNGTDVYVVVNAFTTPYRNDTTSRRAGSSGRSCTPMSLAAPSARSRSCTEGRR